MGIFTGDAGRVCNSNKMDKFRKINRKFIGEKIVQLELDKSLNEIEEHLSRIPELPGSTVVKWIRHDRGSR